MKLTSRRHQRQKAMGSRFPYNALTLSGTAKLLCTSLICTALLSCGGQRGQDNGQENNQGGKNAFISAKQAQLADSLGTEMSAAVMQVWKDPIVNKKPSFRNWSYDEGVILKGIEGRWQLTGDGKYYTYMQHSMDDFVSKDGVIRNYDSTSYKLDDINNGKVLLSIYRITGKKNYWKAVQTLRNELRHQPRTYNGGFWHKTIYPNQMWLDGLYMAAPFYAEYAQLSGNDTAFNDIGKQFVLMERFSRDQKTGLLYHGWDASKKQKWANKQTGASPEFWGRAMGWYAMALVDALDYFPADQPYRDSLIGILNRLSTAVVKVQDTDSHCWWQVLDKGGEKGNYLESSASCMFVYALAKGVRKGYLPAKFEKAASEGFIGITKQFLVQRDGRLALSGTCAVAGLGGKPYRDGSYKYYVDQRPVINDPKGVGAFLLAANEIQIGGGLHYGHSNDQQKTVLLDNYFNHEVKTTLAGVQEPFHYTFNDRNSSGFSLWGDVFNFLGAKTATLTSAPTAASLKEADVYMIVDPDTKKETKSPNFVAPADVDAIKEWVSQGGVLVLLANDTLNAEFKHFNQLADAFGMHFDGNSLNRVQGHAYQQGAVKIAADNPIFKTVSQVYIKELSSLQLKDGAQPVLQLADGQVAGAIQPVGKGIVLAIGDPWLYNEYVDGRKLPLAFENYKAMTDLSKWLLNKAAD